MKTIFRHASAPLTLVALLALALLALSFVPSGSIAHAGTHTLAYWIFAGKS